jgi:hypothetical protein
MYHDIFQIVYSTPCHESDSQCVASPVPPCGGPPAEHHEHKDNSKEKKEHKKCKDKKKKKKKKKKEHKKKCSQEEVDISVNFDIDINFYGEKFTECKYVNDSERDVYLVWLDQCNEELFEYIDVIVQYLQVKEALTTDIVNYEIFQEKIYSVYEVFKSKNIYSAHIDLQTQTTIIEEVRGLIFEAMSGLSEQSELYISLKYCMETEVTMIPLFIGLCKSVVMSQEVYFSQHSSRHVTISPSAKHHEDHSKECSKEEKKKKKKKENHSEEEHHKECKEKEKKKKKKNHKKKKENNHSQEINISVNIDIDINYYGEVFTKSEYVANSDRDIYLAWMQKFSADQLEYVDTIVERLEIQEALSTEITDFQMFKENIYAVYETFKSCNIFSIEVDLQSQTSIFEEVKGQVVEAMKGLSQQSALYTSLNYCTESQITMMPMVVGLCKSVVMSQETYFSQTTSSYSSTTTKPA